MTKPRRRTAPPKPGTFAAFVLQQPKDLATDKIAAMARRVVGSDGKPRWPNATPQSVYNARYHYGATAVHAVAAKADAIRVVRRAGSPLPDGIAPELLTAVVRFGVDMTLRAINVVEARGASAVGGTNEAQRKASA